MFLYVQIALASLIAGTLDTVAGLGGGLLLLPVLVAIAGADNAKDAVVLAALIPLGWNIPKLILLRERVNWKAAGLMSVGILPGTLIGAHFLGDISPDILRVAIGLLLIVSGVYSLLGLYMTLPSFPRLSTTAFPLVGFITGAIGAVLGAGHGPLQTGALSAASVPVREISATNGAIGLSMSLTRLLGYMISGSIDAELYLPAAVGILAACIGTVIGIRLSNRTKDSTLDLLIGIVLVVAGIKMFF